jgi:hypothetical protein
MELEKEEENNATEKKTNEITDIDELLHLKLIGSFVEEVFENGQLPNDHPFSWEFVYHGDPKR